MSPTTTFELFIPVPGVEQYRPIRSSQLISLLHYTSPLPCPLSSSPVFLALQVTKYIEPAIVAPPKSVGGDCGTCMATSRGADLVVVRTRAIASPSCSTNALHRSDLYEKARIIRPLQHYLALRNCVVKGQHSDEAQETCEKKKKGKGFGWKQENGSKQNNPDAVIAKVEQTLKFVAPFVWALCLSFAFFYFSFVFLSVFHS